MISPLARPSSSFMPGASARAIVKRLGLCHQPGCYRPRRHRGECAARPRVLCYGGGADSFALLLEAIRSGMYLDAVVFENVGDPQGLDPAEWPGTYRHMREFAIPLCEREGIPFFVLETDRYPIRGTRSLFRWLTGDRGAAPRANPQIPVAGPDRICTIIAKVERFERWLDERFPGVEVEVWIGFEAGEENRAKKDPNAGTGRKVKPWQAVRVNRFPLIEWRLCRCRCEALIRLAGYPVPRKSACVFCPYASKGDWQTFARELPAQFAEVVKLEADKPPTEKNGIKLSIMGFRTLYRTEEREVDGVKTLVKVKTGNRAPPLPEFIQGEYHPQERTCGVCGERRAVKATGCGYTEVSSAA